MKSSTFVFLLLLTVILVAGCTGRDQFVASSGWSGVTIDETDGVLYVGSRDGRVLALEVASGAQRAVYPPTNQDPLGGLYSTPAVARDTLYVGEYNASETESKLYALNARDLALRWKYPADASGIGKIVGGVTLANGLVIFGSSDKHVRALDAESGNLVWQYNTGHMVWSTPEVVGDTVYFGSLDHNVYALSLRDGSLVWDEPFKTDGAVVMQPLVEDGKVYVGSFDANLYALDAESGKEEWRFKGDGWFWSSPVTDGERIYVAARDGTVYGLDIGNGHAQWRFDLQNPTTSTPVLVNGSLVVASDSGLLHVLSTQTGTQDSQYNVGAEVRAPLTTDGESVYVNAMDKRVWAIRMAGRQEKVWEVNTEDLLEG